MTSVPRILVVTVGLLAATSVLADDSPQQDPGMTRQPINKDGSRIPEKRLELGKPKGNEDDIDGRFAFGYLKKLTGSWTGSLPDGSTGRACTISSGAAGGVLLVTLFPGTEQEMVSVYYMEGEDLTVTHYDPAGTQPRLRFDSGKSYPGKYFFKFSGGTGFDKAKDRHIHEGSIQFHNPDQITVEWVGFDGLSRSGSRVVKLQRDRSPSDGGSR
jgi:hypothetical protein